MADFFSRLAERALGVARTIQPKVVPLYAPELQHRNDTMLVDEEQEQIAQYTTPAMPMPTIQNEQTSIAQPATQQVLPSASDNMRTPIQEDKLPQPYPAINNVVGARLIAPSAQFIERDSGNGLSNDTEYLHISPDQSGQGAINRAPTTEGTSNRSGGVVGLEGLSRPIFQEPSQQLDKLGDIHHPISQSTPVSLPDTNGVKQAAYHVSQSTSMLPVDAKRARQASPPIPTEHPRPYGYERHSTLQFPQIEGVDEHIYPSTPTIQVTIGRIEVRATTTPTPSAQTQRHQEAPPVMSLDDYLHQRAKGER